MEAIKKCNLKKKNFNCSIYLFFNLSAFNHEIIALFGGTFDNILKFGELRQFGRGSRKGLQNLYT